MITKLYLHITAPATIAHTYPLLPYPLLDTICSLYRFYHIIMLLYILYIYIIINYLHLTAPTHDDNVHPLLPDHSFDVLAFILLTVYSNSHNYFIQRSTLTRTYLLYLC